jgi:hypothetical protein
MATHVAPASIKLPGSELSSKTLTAVASLPLVAAVSVLLAPVISENLLQFGAAVAVAALGAVEYVLVKDIEASE